MAFILACNKLLTYSFISRLTNFPDSNCECVVLLTNIGG